MGPDIPPRATPRHTGHPRAPGTGGAWSAAALVVGLVGRSVP